jgi:hypothetical protein
MTVSTPVRSTLSGDELINYVAANCTLMSNSQMCEEAGYPSQDKFRDALTAARLFRGEYKDQHGIPQFDVELLEHLEWILSISQSEVIDIAVILRDDYDVNDLQDFQDLYAWHSEEYNWEAEFAEYWACDVMCYTIADDCPGIVIDWEATWNCNLRHDFSTIEPDREAEIDWGLHVNEVAGLSLRSTCSSWYVGANVPGKPRVFSPYIGGFPKYVERCEQVVGNNYEGFTLV